MMEWATRSDATNAYDLIECFSINDDQHTRWADIATDFHATIFAINVQMDS